MRECWFGNCFGKQHGKKSADKRYEKRDCRDPFHAVSIPLKSRHKSDKVRELLAASHRDSVHIYLSWLRSSVVEQGFHKAVVGGSNPPAATKSEKLLREAVLRRPLFDLLFLMKYVYW